MALHDMGVEGLEALFSVDPWAEVLRKVRGGFHNGLTGMGFILPEPCFL